MRRIIARASLMVLTFSVSFSVRAQCVGEVTMPSLTINGGEFVNEDVTDLSVDLCESNIYSLSGTTPSIGESSIWRTVSGSSVSINNSSVPVQTSSIQGVGNTVLMYVLRNACGDSAFAEVGLTVDEEPTKPAAMTDFDACVADVITLPGTQATVGTGVWTFVSNNAATVDDVNLFNSGVIGLVGNEVMTATWTVSNGVCPDQAETVVITGKGIADPFVMLSADQVLACEGEVINFTASGVNVVTAPLYTFYDGQNGIVQGQSGVGTLAITVSQDTTIYVELEGNSNCLSDPLLNTAISSPIAITVDALPSPSNAGVNIGVCQSSTSLGATPPTSGIGSWEKVSGPGTVVPGDENNPNATVNGLTQGIPTIFNWVVRSDNGFCPSNSSDVEIDFALALSPANVAAQSTVICETSIAPVLLGSAFDEIGNPAEMGTWYALGPAMISQTGLNGTISNLQVGDNKFVWTIRNGLCRDVTDTVYITVDEAPDAAVYNGVNPLETCGATELDAQALAVGTGTWTHISGPGNIIAGEENLANARVEGLQSGVSSEFRWSTNNGVCIGSSVNVTIDRLADVSSAEIGLSGDLSLALGTATSADLCETGTYNILSSVFATHEIGSWSVNSGTSVAINTDDSNSQAVLINSTGTTQVEWRIANKLGGGCPDVTVTMDLIVHAEPEVVISTDAYIEESWWTTNQASLALTTNATNFHWRDELGDEFGHNQSPYIHTFATSGEHVMTAMAEGGVCADASDQVLVNFLTVGIDDELSESDCLFPNPNKGVLHYTGPSENFDFRVYNSMGEEVKRGAAINGEIDLSELAPAQYFIKMGEGPSTSIVVE